MRFTLDSNILVRAATSPRGPALRLLDIIIGAHTLVLSRFIAADLVEPVIARPMILSDHADDAVLYTAVDGKAQVLCTRNLRHFASAEVQSFCAEVGIRVMTDLEALRDLL